MKAILEAFKEWEAILNYSKEEKEFGELSQACIFGPAFYAGYMAGKKEYENE